MRDFGMAISGETVLLLMRAAAYTLIPVTSNLKDSVRCNNARNFAARMVTSE